MLSALAYEENPNGEGYDSLAFFDDEPDQALVVEQDGYCFAAFRGTTLTWEGKWQEVMRVLAVDHRDQVLSP
jgi:hypothetical protein